MYDNSGFEGLTISPDHKKLFLAMERALPTSGCRSILPILEYSLADHSTKTYWYQMQWNTKGNGISSLVALSDYELLVIERDYLKAEDRNEVNIYKITLIEASKNNDSDCPQSGESVLVPEKIFSFSQDLKLGGQPYKVNNIEGATFTPDGQYLLLVSDNNFGNKGNRTPTQDEVDLCLPFIERHIALKSPDILVLAGGISAQALLRSPTGITRLRGHWHDYAVKAADGSQAGRSIPALPMFHPSYLLRRAPEKQRAWQDLQTLELKLGEAV